MLMQVKYRQLWIKGKKSLQLGNRLQWALKAQCERRFGNSGLWRSLFFQGRVKILCKKFPFSGEVLKYYVLSSFSKDMKHCRDFWGKTERATLSFCFKNWKDNPIVKYFSVFLWAYSRGQWVNDNAVMRESSRSDLTCRKLRCCICPLLPELTSSTEHNEYLHTAIIFGIGIR